VRTKIKTFIDRFMGQGSALPTLDLLVSSVSPKDTLANRLNWLVDLVQWIRRPGDVPAESGGKPPPWQHARLRWLLDVLDRQPEWKRNVAQTLRSVIRDTSALQLLSETGLPRQFGLLQEVCQRLTDRFVPAPPDSFQLGGLFDRLFSYRYDAEWIRSLDEVTVRRFIDLLHFEEAPEDKNWNTLGGDLDDAAILLSTQLRVSGCSDPIRSLIEHQRIRDLPFFKVSTALQSALAARDRGEAQMLVAELNYLHLQADQCCHAVEALTARLEHQGVNTDVVYQVTFIEASVARLELLVELAFNPELPPSRYSGVLAQLVEEHQARKSVADLLRKNFRLLARKMVERTAETGEHYFSRTRDEYRQMVWRAAGGGAIMAFTTWFKSIILGWQLAGLLEGIGASLNYSVGFVAIQFTGCTLATKQPATTAPALAARMHELREPEALEALVDEVATLMRSQTAAIVGNLVVIVPVMMLICLGHVWLHGVPLFTAEKSDKVLHSLSVLGGSPIYAAWTGVLLCASSLVAAWADNWFAYRRIGPALETDRHLMRVLGSSRTIRFSRFLGRNVSGMAGNISLGFMLGVLPELAKFAGIPLDIRHVTLSAGTATAAVVSLGPWVLMTWTFWLALLGIGSIGLLNVAISFAVALWVAGRARGLRRPERRVIYEAVAKRLWRLPLTFLFLANPAPQSTDRSLPPIGPAPVEPAA
jgi:site-specific recombinase